MPFFIVSILGGAGIAYALIESGYAIEAFIAFFIFCLLLYLAPALAIYFAGAIIGLGALLLVLAYWEVFAGIALGCFMFLFLVGGLLHAIGVLTK